MVVIIFVLKLSVGRLRMVKFYETLLKNLFLEILVGPMLHPEKQALQQPAHLKQDLLLKFSQLLLSNSQPIYQMRLILKMTCL